MKLFILGLIIGIASVLIVLREDLQTIQNLHSDVKIAQEELEDQKKETMYEKSQLSGTYQYMEDRCVCVPIDVNNEQFGIIKEKSFIRGCVMEG